MKKLLVVLLLTGCAQSGKEEQSRPLIFPKQKCCMERFSTLDVIRHGRVICGQLVPTCNHWCVGKDAGKACGCQLTCSCKD